MKKINKRICLAIAVALSIAFVTSLVWILTIQLSAPDKEKIENYFQRDKDDLMIVADYLSHLDYSYVLIDKSGVSDGIMFTGASTRNQKICDDNALESLNSILNSKAYITVEKNGNTICFLRWSFLEQERGIAVSVDKVENLSVEFLVESEPLSKIGWYYYEADYEVYRNQ